ncbi:MAG: hypothetical protein AB7H97_21405 [Pseudobdellovibrionaceae bacterium]
MNPNQSLKILIYIIALITFHSLAFANVDGQTEETIGIHLTGEPAKKIYDSLSVTPLKVKGEGIYKMGRNIFCLKNQPETSGRRKVFLLNGFK